MEKFKEWFDKLLKNKNWNYSDLSRASGVDTAVISNIVNGKRGLGPEIATAFGQALDLRPDLLLRKYGTLPAISEELEEIERLTYRISLLPHDTQENIETYIDALLDKQGKVENNKAKVTTPKQI